MKRFSRRAFELSPNKRALLEMLLQQESLEEPSPLPQLSRRQGDAALPLSFAQQRLWFLDQWEPESSTYSISRAFPLSGSLTLAALEHSFNELVRRHEALRTTFALHNNSPVQVIAPGLTGILSLVDLTELSPDEREAQADHLARQEAQRPFDLARGPLLRVHLLRFSTQQHVLLLTIHHSVCDGWSLGVLLRELGILYQAFLTDQPAPLPALPLQYADYALWQRTWLQGEALEAHLAYWQAQLAGAPAVLALPTDHPRPPLQTFRGAHLLHELPQELAAALKDLSRRAGVTLFMTLLAAFATLLWRYSGQDDLLIGTPIANRRHQHLEGLIGNFANTLVLRLDLSGTSDVPGLLGRVREVCLGAYAHQDLPFEKLVEVLAPARDLSRSPLFQVLFSLQHTPTETLHLPGLTASSSPPGQTNTARVDLMLTLLETQQGLRAHIEYSTDLFESATIARLAAHYQRLLEAMVADPAQRLADLPLLTQAERQLLLLDWNATRQAYPHDLCLPQLFEAQVARTPDAIALVWEEQQLTYHDLNCRANQLAHLLLAHGIGPEHIVGLCLERSPDLLIALLAILKTGAAYLPLDPRYPTQRLAFMLTDAHASLLLTHQSWLQHHALPATTTLCLETLSGEHDEAHSYSLANPHPLLLPENLAYVIYTSGSTGQPKGVAITHRSACALLTWAQRVFAPALLRGMLASTSICFDLSVFELLLPLSSGGTVLLVDDLLHLPGTPAAQALTLLNTVPSVLAAFLAAAPLPPTLRTVTLAGETLPADLLHRLYALPAIAQVYNLYGPSEDTTYSTWALLASTATDPLPIGHPIANSQAYVLDPQGQPVPIGVVGELYLGGDGLARGYLGQSALTAERFLPDPFSGTPGARLYRTGDLVRSLPDGTLVFLGRADSQIKLRGYRIELGEIEAVLRQHASVHAAVVALREDTAGDRRLVAYVVPQAQPVPQAELRAFLAHKLPDYMLPSAFVPLEVLPLSPNGKLDRSALPAPERLRPEETLGYRAPRTPLEELLVGIWAEVLGLERIGIDDNFFALGGHSLLATQVVARLRAAWQADLPLRALFEAPTVASLAERVAMASLDEQGLRVPPLRAFSREETLPLSFAQQRLWFLGQLEPESAAYHLPVAMRLSGTLQVRALEDALDEIVRRHEVLRTTFATYASSPIQCIRSTSPLTRSVVDLRDLPPVRRESLAQQLARQEVLLPFDLERGPLLRVSLLRLENEAHVLLVTMHHIVMDGWSLGVLLRELSLLYQAYALGQPSPLLELPVQYADYALWQRQWLQGEVLETQLAYWQQHLQDAPPRLELPTDRPRPVVQTFTGAHHRFTLSQELTRSLVAVSRRAGVTLFMTLLSAFATLLWRYSGQDDLLIGTPIANRTHPQLEDLIGCFINTLVLRADLSGDPSFQQLLGRVREVTLQAYAHQDVPFEQVVEALQPQRDLSHTPLFQVMFVLQNAPREAIELPGLRLRPLDVELTTSRFELTLTLQESAQGLEAMLEYNTDLFEAATMARMARHWQTLLEGMVADPEQSLSRLPLLTQAECEQLLLAWNKTGTTYPSDQCLHQLFEAQVARTPDAIAVVFQDEQLSYRELNQRANQLAHHLQKRGVKPEVLVGLYLEERSPEMIVGVLGILKAGGAYLPLDPALPTQRLAFMLADAQASLVLTQQSLLPQLPASGIQEICLDGASMADEHADNPTSSVQPGNLAYAMYTSGSTGQPKGVCISHMAVNRLVCNTNYVQLDSADSMAHASNPAFDAATFEIWGALLHGARLVGVAKDVALSPRHFAAHLQQQGVRVLFLTTALLNQAASEVPWAFRSLRHLLFGGEAVDPKWVKEVLDAGPPERLLHVYGPTENTTFSSWLLVQAVPPGALTIPIGRPISNTQLYLLDAWFQPVPAGIPGELYIGGDGLARGYLHRPDLTAERFVPHPFSGAPGARLYRTGDLARYLPDGSIEFVGRVDQQIKLRGFRIELGEIEAVLAEHPGIREAAVVAREDVPGDRRLVAYVVPFAEHALTLGDVRGYMQTRLPDYMLPSAFMLMEALPLSPNGKVDRRALQAPDGARPELEEAYVAPRSPTEELLADIWSDVLRLERIGIYDPFFQIGGHSLLATQVMARVRDAFQVEVPLRALFEAPTVAGLAEHIAIASQAEQGLQVPPLHPMPHPAHLPLSFAQQRLWFLDQLEPESPFYNISASFHLTGTLHLPALHHSLLALARRHDSLRTSLRLVDDAPTQLVAAHLPLPLILVSLEHLPASQHATAVAHLAHADARHPFDLAHAPLFRCHLLRLDPQQHVLLLSLHHIIADGWSLGVLLRELGILYQAFLTDQPAPLPALPLQYADYALWQHAWLQGEALQTQLAYWQAQLAGAPAVLALPTDHPRPPLQTFRGAQQLFLLPQPLTHALQTLSRRAGVTLFMTLLAAFATLLWRYSGQDDLLIGTPIANRRHQHLEGLIGLFVNTLALRLDLSGTPDVLTLLARVREVCLGAYAHQDLPFEKLVEALAPARDLSRSPLFQVLFSLQHTPTETLQLPGLTSSSPLPGQTGTARVDLMLTLLETQQGLRAHIEYSTDLFEPATIVRLAAHYQRLLEAMVADPAQRLADLPLLTQAERQLLLREWNATRQAYPHDVCLPQLFEAQVARTPDAIALVSQHEQFSYHDLNCRANQLAHLLLAHGIGPEHIVGLCLERSPDLLIALLAILKTGAAYLPLDPRYPTQRLAFMLTDAHASLLLTHQSWLQHHELPETTTLCLETLSGEHDEAHSYSLANPHPPLLPENLAYVIYTSGSTGQPKGVAITHRSACALLAWAQRVFAPALLRGMLASTSICFDLSVFELLLPLSSGGTVLLVDDLLHLPGTPAAQALTWLNTVPSVLAAFLAAAPLPPTLRTVTLAGETLPADLLHRLYALPAIAQVYNLYGPSEDTTYSTWALLAPTATDPLPIGHPIANSQAYVLDPQGQPVPIGVVGELYLGGTGLARGYLGQPALTAERFVPDPFSDQPGARLYRTGDLVRSLPDGTLIFLGRADSQVKLRGYRIELGEIEAVLRQHASVRAAVVALREDTAGDRRLVAYVVPQAQPVPEAELRAFLAHKLPDYMLPAAFVPLEVLPLSPNGKLDRSALPAPERLRPEETLGYVAPRTPLEELLVGIWAEVLGLERIGISDNFFALGGHSLLATQVVARLRAAWQAEVPLRSLFEAPTVASLAQHLTSMSGEQTTWLEDALAIVAARGRLLQHLPMEDALAMVAARGRLLQHLPTASPLQLLPRPAELPLAFAQQRLWFLHQLEPESPAYHLPVAMRLSGTLQVRALEDALDEIVRRHEVLRTTFAIHATRPTQHIHPPRPLQLAAVDLRGLPPVQRESLAQQLARQEALLPFDLERGPLLRVSLLRLENEAHELLVTMHHVVSDGWSLGILLRELGTFYQAYAMGQPSPLPALPFQYTDYALWQRQWLQGEVLETQLAYWQKQLTGAPSVLALPTDHPRPAAQTFRGAQQLFVLPQALTDALKALSRHAGVTLFMTLLAAFATLLWRYSGQDDLLIGTPIANRRHSELESLIGCFANTLVLRTNLADNPSVRTLLGHVRQVTLDAYAHQDVPFEHVVEALQPQRDLSRSPLFQVVLTLQHGSHLVLDLGDVKSQQLAGTSQTTKFDLTLSMQDNEQGLVGALEYSTDLFEAATIARMARHWQTLLEGMVADPEQSLSRLPLLTQAEREQLLLAWNKTDATYPSDQCLHQIFEAQVARTPDAIAVVFQDEQLSYRELNQRANQLAHYLQRLDVRPEVVVGIYLERSLELVVGMLGVLKAGGAYLPLDPTYPQQRLAFMLADAHVSVVLTQQRLKDSAAATRRVCLDSDWQLIAQQDVDQPAAAVVALNLAYVIYTSGSTGRPKGVAITHHNLLNLLYWHLYTFSLTPTDRASHLAGLSFDAATWELWPSLLAGSCLCLLDDHTRLAPALLQPWLSRYAITRCFLPTPLAEQLLTLDWSHPTSLRTLLVGGDLLHPVPALPLPFALVNNYGPTEHTVVATSGLLTLADRTRLPAIGRPIANTRLYLLDAAGQPVPIGVTGELYLGGDSVARGYLGQPALTAERFVPDPFSGEPGARLYRTGDLVRYRPDGMVDFLGRADSQVKLRGYRIELGEIEAVLRQHPGVREAVVLLREEVPGDKRLLAYFVPTPQRIATVGDIRGYMQAQLPDYMLPSAFVVLEALPLSPNGKVDHKALPLPSQEQAGYVAPRTPLEEIIALTWAEVLGLQRVGVDDNFFVSGGHSLLATQVVARLREILHREVPLRTFFEAPTVAELARSLNMAKQDGMERSMPAPHSFSHQGPLPLSFAQQRLWFLDQLEPHNPFYNISASFHLAGPLHLPALHSSLQALLHRHDILRTSLVLVDGSPTQLVTSHMLLPLPVIALDHLSPSEQPVVVAQLAQAEAQRPFDLTAAPLLRTHVLRLAPQEHVFLLTMHHSIADGWSLSVLLRELSSLYQAYVTGQPPALPELPLQYADYALWQRQYLQGERLQAQLAYWQAQLAQAPALLDLPTDHPRPAVQTFRGAQLGFTLPGALTEALHVLSRRYSVTLFMTLLAAFATLLSRYSDRDDLLIGTPIANRRHQALEALVGNFANTLVLRADLSGSPRVCELLARIREICLDAYAHQDLPFEQLVEVLAPERSLSHSPLFQVMFALQNAPLGPLNLAELTLTPGDVADIGIARLDLALNLVETAQGLRGYFEYNTDLFEATTIERMGAHLQQLLEGMINDPLQQIADLPLLTERERAQLLLDWNATRQTYPHEVCLHQLFEAQVVRTPDAIAIVCEEEQLTYRELNGRANRLANYLQRLGVGPEVTVGICLERSPNMTVSVLGILKAGGAFVPLDPAYPAERLSFMLQDCHIPLLLTQQSPSAAFGEQRVPCLFLDLDAQAIAGAPESNPPCQVQPQNVAYVIYTSGSTGQPKGVMVSHQAIVNRLLWGHMACQLTPHDSMLHIASLSFDIAIWEIFAPWLAGARLILAREGGYSDISYLISLLNQQSITIAHFVPTLLELLVEHETFGTCRSLRWVLYGGEASSPELPRRLLARLDSGLQQFYGPTEAAINATCWRCEDEQDAGQVSIGRPIANTRIYLLGARQQPVPVGVTGELYIGGFGLARGYFRRPELTAERFLPDPFSSQPGQRLYRTGDLARFLPDGSLVFVGRNDDQVKLHGIRIEPVEIESVLGRHPLVREAVVELRQDPGESGDKRLVAYVVPQSRRSEGEVDTDRFSAAVELWPSIGEYFVYDDLIYHGLTHDEPRNALYRAALSRVAAGKVVVDIGTGRDAILARLCVEAGARRVYAIEVLEESYIQAKALVSRLGLQDRIIVLHGDATRIALSEAADLCVTEIFEAIGGAEGAAVILNAARRWLTPGALVIPHRSRTRMAAVSLPDTVRIQPAFTSVAGHYVEKIFEQVGYKFDLRLCIKNFPPSQLLSDTAIFEDLDFRGTVEPDFQRQVTLKITKNGRLDGFLLWLILQMSEDEDGEVLDILDGQYAWFPAYFPVFDAGIEVSAGDVVQAACSGRLCENGINPDYAMIGRVFRQNGETVDFHYESPHHQQRYKATGFYAQLFRDDAIPIRQARPSDMIIEELRRYLHTQLPQYMVPSMFVLLDALPLTPNGKVDRRALPDPADAGSRPAVAYVAPQSEIEHTIAQTWREVLDVEKIGRHDNFFDLGGHSLLMIRVQSKLREVLHRDLSIVDMFKYPTISALATYLGQAQSDSPPRHGDDRAEKRREGHDRQQRLRAQSKRGTKGAKEL